MSCHCEHCQTGSSYIRFRWHLRESLRKNDGWAMKQARLCLSYGEISIGPVINLRIRDDDDSPHPAFYEITLSYLTAMFVEQMMIWWLHLRGNAELATSGLYKQMKESEKLSGLWPPYSTFSASGEAVAIEGKLHIAKIAAGDPTTLYMQSMQFLTPVPNSPTPKQYVLASDYGKRGRYDPGPVFGCGTQLSDLYPIELEEMTPPEAI